MMSCSNDARTYVRGNEFQECPQWECTAIRDYVQHHCVLYVCKDQHSCASMIFSWGNRVCNEAHAICILHTAARDTVNNARNKRAQHVVAQCAKVTRLVCLAPALVSIVDSDMFNLCAAKLNMRQWMLELHGIGYISTDHLDAPLGTI